MDTKPTFTYSKKVGCGNIYILFIEHNNTNFHKVIIRGAMSRHTSCGNSWFGGMAGILTYSLRRGFIEHNVERGLIEQLKHHRCGEMHVGSALSCADAISWALNEYLKMRKSRDRTNGKEEEESPKEEAVANV